MTWRKLLSLSLSLLTLLTLLSGASLAQAPSDFAQISVEPQTSQQNEQFGLAFISSPENIASPARVQGALDAGAKWDRWPLYWHWVEGNGGNYVSERFDYDTLVIQDINSGLTPIAILLGTPDWRAERGSAAVAPPRVRDKNFVLSGGKIASDYPISTAASPPSGLFEPIFADGTDQGVTAAGTTKAVNAGNSWATFVANSVQRYMPGGTLAQQQGWTGSQGVRHWEIWNEPDLDQFWNGSVAEYYRLMQVAYNTIKAIDPQAEVLFGGLSFFEDPTFFSEYLDLAQQNGGQYYFDILSYHYYWSIYGGEHWFVEVRNELNAHGLRHVPIWITESGVPVWNDFPATQYGVPGDSPWRGTMDEQAAYIIQKAATAFYNNVEIYMHFMLHDDCGNAMPDAFGLRQNFSPHACNPADGHARPGYEAYQLAAQQFQKLTPHSRDKTATYDRLTFSRPSDKARVSVAWALQGQATPITIPANNSTAQLYWVDSVNTASGTGGEIRTQTITAQNGVYQLTLPAATNKNSGINGDTTYYIGGQPYILVETNVSDQFGLWINLPILLKNTPPAPTPTPGPSPTPNPNGVSVGGTVVDASGQAVANATVTVNDSNGQTVAAYLSDAQGRWQGSLPAGSYQLLSSASGFSSWPHPRNLTLTASRTDILLTLPPSSNAVSAGNFEGNNVWLMWQTPNGQASLTTAEAAFDGQQAVRLGDQPGLPLTCSQNNQPGQLWTLKQTVAVPNVSSPGLSFLADIDTSQNSFNYAWLEVVVIAKGQPTYLIEWGDKWQSQDWHLTGLDLSPWKGQTVDLLFQVVNCSSHSFTATLDRVSVGKLTSASQPGPTPTPPASSGGYSVTARQLTACENMGKHHLFIYVEDAQGKGIPGVEVEVTWGSESVILTTGTKAQHQGLVDFGMYHGEYKVNIVGSNAPTAGPFTTNIPVDEICEENGEWGNTWFHYSYEIVYTQN